MSGLFETRDEEGTALCLSGGGYRAMLFHTGVIWRLYELGKLRDLTRISSVSGGSITSAVLGMCWKDLSFDPARLRDDFVPRVVDPIFALAGKTLDAGSILGGVLWFGSVSSKVAKAYAKHLFGDATLQDLPDAPRFVINATNVQSGALWRFSKPYMGDYKVGRVMKPDVALSVAVGASSAFPPIMSPARMEVDPSKFEPGKGVSLQRKPFTSEVFLTDGGVYDNMGLETASRFRTLFVSDAGGNLTPEEKPKSDWVRHATRVLLVIDNQVRSIRKRELIAAFKDERRKGAFWAMSTDLADFGLTDGLLTPHDRTLELANVPTRLAKIPSRVRKRLINFGYAACDAGLRGRVDKNLAAPADFPYTGVGV